MRQFVYVLEDQKTQLIKIGISLNPSVRAQQINREFGCSAVLLGVLEVSDAYKTERFIHGMLSDCRIVGEWFEVPAKKRGFLLSYFSDKPPHAVKPRRATESLSAPAEILSDAAAQNLASKAVSHIGPSRRHDDFAQIRAEIKRLMKQKGLTQRDLAAKLGISEKGSGNLTSVGW